MSVGDRKGVDPEEKMEVPLLTSVGKGEILNQDQPDFKGQDQPDFKGLRYLLCIFLGVGS